MPSKSGLPFSFVTSSQKLLSNFTAWPPASSETSSRSPLGVATAPAPANPLSGSSKSNAASGTVKSSSPLSAAAGIAGANIKAAAAVNPHTALIGELLRFVKADAVVISHCSSLSQSFASVKINLRQYLAQVLSCRGKNTLALTLSLKEIVVHDYKFGP